VTGYDVDRFNNGKRVSKPSLYDHTFMLNICSGARRKQLDEQIHGTFKACGFADPIAAKSRNHLQQLLSNPKGKTIMTTIQKFGSQEKHIQTEQKVIAIVDEAHRT
jgi:SWI2/SNF2 ATPase-like protein